MNCHKNAIYGDRLVDVLKNDSALALRAGKGMVLNCYIVDVRSALVARKIPGDRSNDGNYS